MKFVVALCASLMLMVNSSFADPIQSQLAAGKPAGTRAAQDVGIGDNTWYIIGGLALVGIIVGVAVSGGNDNAPAAPPITSSPTTTS
jgi:hypothetical protein